MPVVVDMMGMGCLLGAGSRILLAVAAGRNRTFLAFQLNAICAFRLNALLIAKNEMFYYYFCL